MGSSMTVQPLADCHYTCILINWSVLRQLSPFVPIFVFTMAGGEQTGDNNPKGFNERVSQEQLQAVVEDAQKWMNEAVR